MSPRRRFPSALAEPEERGVTDARRLRHHSRRRRLRGFGYLGRLGPGLVTGASDDDPSGIGTYSQVGAAFGYGLLWTAVVSLPLAAAVQECAARLGLVKGKGLVTCIKERFPRWIPVVAVVLVVSANVFNISADLAAMAAATRLVLPLPYVALLFVIAGTSIGLEVALPYRRYARVLRWLTLSLVSYVVVLAVVRVPWRTVGVRTVVPRLSFDRVTLAALIALFGTTISPYLFFWQTSEEVEEEQEREMFQPVTSAHLSAMRADVIAGMLSAVAVMFAIMVASAATLGAHGITTVGTADQAARALRPLAGRLAGLLFALGVVGTGALAVPVLAGSTAYAVSEALGWREGLARRFREAHGFYGAIALSVVVGLGLDLAGVDPIRGLYLAAILNGLAAPPLIALMLVMSISRRSLPDHRGGWLSTTLLGAALVIMLVLPIAYLLSGR